jgi:hypothetical protein
VQVLKVFVWAFPRRISRYRGNRRSWTGKEGALKASIGGRRVVGLADMKCDALLGSGDLMMPAG